MTMLFFVLLSFIYLSLASLPSDPESLQTEGDDCPHGSEPYLPPSSTYVSKGTVITLKDDLPLYTVGSGTSAVIVFYDIYGFNAGRVREVCDQIAEAGFFVVMPDIYRGNPWDDNRTDDRNEWLRLFPPTLIKADSQTVFEFLEDKSILRVGFIGFCWGAFAGFQASSMDRIKAGVNCHPSLGVGSRLFNIPEVEQAAAVQSPQLLLPAGNDPDNVKPGGDVQKVFDQKPWGDQCGYYVFTGMSHGFVLRGDITNPDVARDVQLALNMAIDYFKLHLNQ